MKALQIHEPIIYFTVSGWGIPPKYLGCQENTRVEHENDDFEKRNLVLGTIASTLPNIQWFG